MKLVILTLAAVLASTPPAHPVDPAGNRVLGEWRGTSLCTNRKLAPACKDEMVRYVFTGPADSTGTYHLVAEKLVGEAFQFMGDADLGYTAADSTWSFGFTSPGCKGCRWWFRIGPAGLVGGLLSGEGDTLRAVAAHPPGTRIVARRSRFPPGCSTLPDAPGGPGIPPARLPVERFGLRRTSDMKRWLLPAAVAAVAACAVTPGAWANTDLVISEYIEGTSNNKAIEIWNHTGAAVDLTAGGYKLQIYFNGAVTPLNTIALSGVLADEDVYVVAHSSATAAILAVADLTSSSLSFNGDDAVVLVKGGANSTVDAFGQIGFDPGAEWGAGLQSTADNTLRRKPTVCDGDLNGSDVFDPSVEWDGFATDTFDGLGTHADACGPVPVTRSTWGSVKSLYR